MGTMWVRLTRPTVGLKPTIPLTLAGQVIEPSVSVPIAAQASPAATAAPLPEEEPHALRSVAWGFLVRPPTALHPLVERLERILAHSDKLVFPSTTPPASRSRAISGASRPVRLSFSARLPAVVGHSRVSMLSLTSTVRPPSGRPAAARASAGAFGLTTMTEFSAGPAPSIAAMRARWAAASSPGSARAGDDRASSAASAARFLMVAQLASAGGRGEASAYRDARRR